MNDIELYDNYIRCHTKEELELAWADNEFISNDELSPIANFIAYDEWWKKHVLKILNEKQNE